MYRFFFRRGKLRKGWSCVFFVLDLSLPVSFPSPDVGSLVLVMARCACDRQVLEQVPDLSPGGFQFFCILSLLIYPTNAHWYRWWPEVPALPWDWFVSNMIDRRFGSIPNPHTWFIFSSAFSSSRCVCQGIHCGCDRQISEEFSNVVIRGILFGYSLIVFHPVFFHAWFIL